MPVALLDAVPARGERQIDAIVHSFADELIVERKVGVRSVLDRWIREPVTCIDSTRMVATATSTRRCLQACERNQGLHSHAGTHAW